VTTAIHRIAGAPFEAYAGPPGRIDVADVVTTAQSGTIAAGFVESEGGPFAYRCDYEAVCIPLDGTMTWETGDGEHAAEPGDVIWIPHGGRAAYRSARPARFVYATFPVNWPEIVGWTAGEDIKDLSLFDDTGTLGGVSLLRAGSSDAAWQGSPQAEGFDHAILTRPRTGAEITTLAMRTKGPTRWTLGQGEGALVVIDGAVLCGGRQDRAGPGDLIWKASADTLALATEGAACLISVSAAPGTATRLAH